jgi:branched-chain amino acid aminotransferase
MVRSMRSPFPPSIDKNFHSLDLTIELFEAYGTDAIVLLNREGKVTEGRGLNVFGVRNGKLATDRSGEELNCTASS